MHDTVKSAADATSLAIALGTVVKLLPAFAALLSIIWTGLRIYDWVQDKRGKRRK